jgi:hypothetical protein
MCDGRRAIGASRLNGNLLVLVEVDAGIHAGEQLGLKGQIGGA